MSDSTPPNKQPQEAPNSNDLDSLRAKRKRARAQGRRISRSIKLLAEINRLTRPSEMPRRVELCREALKLTEPHSKLWASLQNKLANSLSDNPLGSRADNIEQAIEHYKLALQVYTQKEAPHDWADTMNSLANAYSDRIRGERADNLEQAIAYYKQALQVRTRQAVPSDWAMTISNLALAYSSRIRGERADNLEQAIAYYKQALQVYTQKAAPFAWAQIMNNLANALRNRIRGERADNLEEAIAHYKLALQVYTRQAVPSDWAMTIYNLALAYEERIRGERADNLELAIEHYKLALQVYTRQANPFDWAITLHNLALAYEERIRGEQADNLEQAIEYFKLALQVYTRQAAPHKWAMTIYNLALAYEKRIRGERADNLEEAIELYKLALQVTTRQAAPHDWADTMYNLANAYLDRIKGEPADNLEEVIKHYKLALEVRTRQAAPHDWADTMYNLAHTYSKRIKGERANNLERAIEHYKLALQVRTRQATPHKWAMIMNHLALAYSNRIKGERANNLEQAIEHYKLALQVRTRQATPHKWAMIMNNLALAYSNRIRGERADNLEEAIKHYKLALEVRTRQAAPHKWAITMNSLANAYLGRIRGERADNIEQAIEHLKLALQVRTRQAAPHKWAMIIHHLANAYSNRIRGERADNIEQAIKHLKLALEVRTRQATPHKWAMIIHHLALAYSFRIRGERADNIEQAIEYYKQALQVYTRQAAPENWVMTMKNLAGAYSSRIRGEPADNLEEIIEHYKQALTVYTRQAFPEIWAMIQNGLARAYEERIRGERADNIEQAIEHLKQALTIYTRQTAPDDWAMTMKNLARAYQKRIRGERADNIEQAIVYYKLALEVYTHQAAPFSWASTMNNLAAAYYNRIRGERADNLELAIKHYKLMLKVYMPRSFPLHCRETAYVLGVLLYFEGRFSEARQALVVAHEAVEVLRGEVTREAAKRKLMEENAELYARLVFCCLYEGRKFAAFYYAAAAKGRAFVDLLASTRLDLAATGQDDPAFAADWAQYEGVRQEIDQLLLFLTGEQGALRQAESTEQEAAVNHTQPAPSVYGGAGAQPAPSVYGGARAQVRQALEEKRSLAGRLWEEMSFKYPALTACVSVPSLSPNQARQLSAEVGATLVEYYRHARGWCAFVVTPEQIDHVNLPALTDQLLTQMTKWTKNIEQRAGRSILRLKMLDLWNEAVFAPLRSLLPEGGAVIFAPFDSLRLLPLAAARHPKTRRYVAQDYQLAFVPTLTALQIAQQTKPHQPQKPYSHLLGVAYPGTPRLPNVIPEAHAIASYFPQSTLLQEEHATPQAVLQQVRDKEAIHLGCHGTFTPKREEESGLMLAGGWLTVQQIITRMQLQQSRLVTLGACHSWILTQAMMIAGSPSVISSLWSVNDLATRALFEAFYAHLINDYPPANALQEANRLVRDCDGWQHPYYWAPFSVNGLAHGSLPPSSQPVRYSPQKLLDQVRELNRQTLRMRGKQAMNERELKEETKIYLETIIQWHQDVADELRPTPYDYALVVEALNKLAQQATNIQTDQQLLTLCDNIQTLIEEIPALRSLLIERASEITQSQKARKLLLEDFETNSHEEADQSDVTQISQYLRDSHSRLDKHLPPLNEEQQQRAIPRRKSLWQRLGWGR